MPSARRPATITDVALALAFVLAGCKGSAHEQPAPAPPPDDAGVPTRDAAAAWPALAELPAVAPIRVVNLPARQDVPRFDVGGPVVVGDVAVVSSSQFGFLAVDWRRGQVAWSKPAGLHVAPPLVHDDRAILIGDCASPPDVRDTLLGCLRVVTAAGADHSYAAIHGAHVDAFAHAPGPQQVWLDDDHTVRWRRGEAAVSVDLGTGVATAAAIDPPPIRVHDGNRTWEITRTEQRIIAREHGKIAWQTRNAYTSLLGAVYLTEQAPMVRATRIGEFAGSSEMNLLDIDATGSLHGQVAFPVPALSMLGYAIDAVGTTAIAIRLDSSLRHDYIAGFAASALLIYVYPLPELDRPDPVGVAFAPDGVLVFHDGDLFTVLPELSAPATAPGSSKGNPTP
jgi:hypothetical protein